MLPRLEPATLPSPKINECSVNACLLAKWMCACVQVKAPARAAFAGKVSECVCVCVCVCGRARAQGICTCSIHHCSVMQPLQARACSLRHPTRACAMALPRAEMLDPPVSTTSVIRSQPVILEPPNHELDIRHEPAGFMLVKIYLGFHQPFIKVWSLHGQCLWNILLT